MMYRIRWKVVGRVSAYNYWKERMCIAEKKGSFLWLIPVWWPVAEWRSSEAQAMIDIESDKALHEPLPDTRIV